MKSVKPINLSRTKITYLCGASLKTHFDQFKESTESFGGIPSELVEIDTPEIRVGEKDGEEYSEIVIPAEFEPGSIMLFATDMDVGLFPLSSLRPTLHLPIQPFHFSSYTSACASRLSIMECLA